MALKCPRCNQEWTFDNEHIGKNGKKIPLDPATHAPHDCPMREKKIAETLNKTGVEYIQSLEDKDDHGNESYDPRKETQRFSNVILDELKEKYVDHTAAAKGQSKAIVFFGSTPSEVTDEYNAFCARPNVKGQGAHDHVTKDDDGMLFTIFLYYEETA